MFCCSTGDSLAHNDLAKATVDEQIQHIFQLQDPDIVPDLRLLNEGRPDKFNINVVAKCPGMTGQSRILALVPNVSWLTQNRAFVPEFH